MIICTLTREDLRVLIPVPWSLTQKTVLNLLFTGWWWLFPLRKQDPNGSQTLTSSESTGELVKPQIIEIHPQFLIWSNWEIASLNKFAGHDNAAGPEMALRGLAVPKCHSVKLPREIYWEGKSYMAPGVIVFAFNRRKCAFQDLASFWHLSLIVVLNRGSALKSTGEIL